MNKISALLGFAAMSLLTACGGGVEPITDCESVGDMTAICTGLTAEDIAPLPDGKTLLLAHFSGMDHGTAGISFFNTGDQSLRTAYPNRRITSTDWGDAHCTEPPAEQLRPHGTHLHRLATGEWRYLVVNHGNREAVELFQLERDGGDWVLTWRGCAFADESTFMNDVVGLSDGRVIHTKMHGRNDKFTMLKSLFGINTGELWQWSQEQGLSSMPTTAAVQPNGLEISKDEKYLFANMYVEGEVWKVDVATAQVVAKAPIANADNSAWGSDGRLWVTTHNGGIRQILDCLSDSSKPCGASFEIIALDPENMDFESIFEHQGAPMGAATVAVPMGGRVYFGSFAGDRIMSVPGF